MPDPSLQQRKSEHLSLSLRPDVQGNGCDLHDIRLPYDALFSVTPEELDTRSRIAGHEIAFPLMFGAMTGGTAEAAELNTALRHLAAVYGIAMQIGSIRAFLEDNSLAETYGTGHVPVLFANLGASEIERYSPDTLEKACDTLGACGLCIHLNGLQEWMQPGGNHSFSCTVDQIAQFASRFSRPLLIKEVGSGIGGKCAQTLAKTPIAGIETASLGGTSWVKIEALRRKTPISTENSDALSQIGVDLCTAIRDCRHALGPSRTVIASGGIRNAVDLIKCLYLGADLCAVAQPVYAAWHAGGQHGVESWLREWIDVAQIAWRSTGCHNLRKLQHAGNYNSPTFAPTK